MHQVTGQPRPRATAAGQSRMALSSLLSTDPGTAPGTSRITQTAEAGAAIGGQSPTNQLQPGQDDDHALVGVAVQLGRLPAGQAQAVVPPEMRPPRPLALTANPHTVRAKGPVGRPNRRAVRDGHIRMGRTADAGGGHIKGGSRVELLHRNTGPVGPGVVAPLAGSPQNGARAVPAAGGHRPTISFGSGGTSDWPTRSSDPRSKIDRRSPCRSRPEASARRFHAWAAIRGR